MKKNWNKLGLIVCYDRSGPVHLTSDEVVRDLWTKMSLTPLL